MNNQFKNPTFGGFKPNAMQRIAGTLGYTGEMSGFNSYLEQNPDKKNQMDEFKKAAMMMAKGGAVQKFQTGGATGAGLDSFLLEQGYKPPENTGPPQLEFGVVQPNNTLQQAPLMQQQSEQTANQAAQMQQQSAQAAQQAQQYQQTSDQAEQAEQRIREQLANLNYSELDYGGQATQVYEEQPNLDIKKLDNLRTQPMVQAMPQQGQTVQQNAAGSFDIVDASGKVIKTNIDTAEQAQQMTGQQQPITTLPDPDPNRYDPRLGMPDEEAYLKQQSASIDKLFQDANFNEGTSGVNQNLESDKSWSKSTLEQYATNDTIANNPDNYELVKQGNYWAIQYPDGTVIPTGHKNQNFAQGRANALSASFKANADNAAQYKTQQDAYRNYITSGVTGGVTGDIENIEQEFNTAQTNYTQQNLELERLSAQSAANPDDPYLKELVEAKGKEVSDSYARLQQLTPLYQSTQRTIEDEMKDRATDPTLPEGAKQQATLIGAPMQEELIKQTSGQVTGAGGVSSIAQADTYLAQNVEQPDTAKYEADIASDKVAAATGALQAAQTDEDDARAKVTAAMTTASMVGDLNAAQGTVTLMENEVQREIQDGEIITGASADATKAAKFTEQIDAATATPSEKATVQGQLVGLMEQFEGTTPPVWAAGAVRLANQQMAARGLSASSMAGQAVVQAAMESAIPIAQADASTIATFEQQNLSNRQQRAMLAAEQRAAFLGQEFDQDFQSRVLNASMVSDIANMNFTADQQVQLENSRMVQTMNLENLSNRQGMVLAEASALANLDMGNLNNRQQTSVQNAQNFLNMDLANLSNEQQTGIFKTQTNVNAMLTDQAARNASMQFNAQSENQANQFYDNLNSTINMHNSTQANAQSRFNAGQVNEVNKFNAQMKNDREQFNAKNQLIVDQSNAQWRREIATQDTAAINRANEMNALATLDVSNTAYNNMWNMYSDQMSWAVSSYESEAERLNALALETLRQEGSAAATKYANDAKASGAIGSAIVSLLTAGKDSVLGGLFF